MFPHRPHGYLKLFATHPLHCHIVNFLQSIGMCTVNSVHRGFWRQLYCFTFPAESELQHKVLELQPQELEITLQLQKN